MTNPIAAELRTFAADNPEALNFTLSRAEIEAICDSLDAADKARGDMAVVVDQHRATLEADQVLFERMILALRLIRHLCLRPIPLPGSDAAREFLAAYVDRADWGQLPWPGGIPAAVEYLSSCGYLCIDDKIARASIVAVPALHMKKDQP